jgi:hypothetical protein
MIIELIEVGTKLNTISIELNGDAVHLITDRHERDEQAVIIAKKSWPALKKAIDFMIDQESDS